MLLERFILLLNGRVERHGPFRKAGYILLWRKQIGIRNDRSAMGIFIRYLRFMKGSSIPQEKRKVSTHQDLTQDCRRDWRANTEMRYFTFIKLPCVRRSRESLADLTKAVKMAQKCSQEARHRQGIRMCWDNTLPQSINYVYLLL